MFDKMGKFFKALIIEMKDFYNQNILEAIRKNGKIF
jgi:hypothetical protein